MKRALFILAILVAASCSPRITERRVIEYRDSTVVTHEVRDSAIYVPIPLGKDQAITHVGDTSSLETDIAKSIAWVDSCGFMHHSLENKSDKFIKTVIAIPSHTIASFVTQKEASTIAKVEYIDKPLSAWKSFKLAAFWWLAAIALALLIWTLRKPIMKLCKLFI